MSEEAVLRAKIDPSGAESGATAVARAIDSIKNSWVVVSAKAFAAEQAFSRVWALGNKGADFEESLERLNVQMNSFHSTAQLMVNDLRAISNGQLSNASAVELASRALMQGMNPEQIKLFTQAADLLGDVMGTDLKGGFDSILQGLQTGRTQMLANIGVYVDLEKEVKELAVSTNRTTEQITKQERAAIGANAVIKQLGSTLERFSSNLPSDADKMKALEAQFDNLTLAASRFGKSVILSTIEIGESINSKVMDKIRELGDAFDKFVGMKNAFKLAVPDFMLAASELPEGKTTQEVLGRAIVSDTQGNLARQAAMPKPPAAPFDPKLQQMLLAGDLERKRASLEASEKLEEDFRTRAGNANRAKLEGNYITEVEYAKRQADLEKEALSTHLAYIEERIGIEQAALEQSRKIGFDTTEEKIAAEQKTRTAVADLLQQARLTQEKYNTASLEGIRQVKSAERKEHEEEEAWMNEHRALQISLDQQGRQKSLDDEMAYYQALKNYREFNFESDASILAADLDLTRANLAKKTELTQAEASRLLIAWQNHEIDLANDILNRTKLTEAERSTIRLQYLQEAREKELAASNDVAEGWVRGMKRYIKDTQSGFGMAADMARRTAQMMEQSFGKFFFDAMEGKIQSFKDVLKSLLDFTKQIMSQIMGQLITQTVLKGVMAGFSGGFGKPGADVTSLGNGLGSFKTGGNDFMVNLPGTEGPRFAAGGITAGPSIAGEAGPEAVVPLPNGRSIPVQWTGGPYGMNGAAQSNVYVPVKIDIHNEASGAEVQAESQRGADGTQQIKILVKNIVKDGFRNGEFDQSMKQFGTNRQPVRRG